MVYISWKEIHEYVEYLAKFLPTKCSIWPVMRGGYPVASLLIQVRSGIEIRRSLYPYPDDIIVDEICDSGHTLQVYQQTTNKVAVLFLRANAIITPNWYVKNITHKDYLIMPWEKEYDYDHEDKG